MPAPPVPIIWNESVADHTAWDDEFKRRDLPPGAAWWGRTDGHIKRLQYICPCGCAEWRCVSVCQGEKAPGNWLWNGDEASPTLTPSILHIANSADRCAWHGFLTAGQWVTC